MCNSNKLIYAECNYNIISNENFKMLTLLHKSI